MISVVVPHEGGLTQERWQFYLDDTMWVLYLSGYQFERRPTRRHAFKVGRNFAGKFGRENTMTEEEVPLSGEVIELARLSVYQRLTVKKRGA